MFGAKAEFHSIIIDNSVDHLPAAMWPRIIEAFPVKCSFRGDDA